MAQKLLLVKILLLFVENESSLNISAAIASDKLAGNPLMKYLFKHNDTNGIKRLQFWEDVQRYLMPLAYLETHNKYRLAKTIISTYIEVGSPREIPLTQKEREELSRLLPIEEADALLSQTVKQTTMVGIFMYCLYCGKSF